MSSKQVNSQLKNSISITEDVNLNLENVQFKIEQDYENLINETIQNTNINSDVDLVKNLLDSSVIVINNNLEQQEMNESDDAIKLLEQQSINNEYPITSNRQLNHSISSDCHHLYYTTSSIDEQTELERIKQLNTYLMMKIQFLTNENHNLVEKSKEQLSTIRTEKSHEEKLNSLKTQLQIQDGTIDGLTKEANVWKNKYFDLDTKYQQLIEEQSKDQIKFKTINNELKQKNDELEQDFIDCLEHNKELELENKNLKSKLFNSTTDLENVKKNFESCESLKKDHQKSKQKSHVIAEKYEACKIKYEQSTNLLKEKICLIDQQIKEIKDLNSNIIDLKQMNSFNQLEIEKYKTRIDELERKLKDKDELVNEYKLLYNEIKNTRENEIKHEHQTIKALVIINSKYEIQLAQLKGDLELLKYEKMINQKRVPDLIEDNKEFDRLDRLKKKYNLLDNDDDLDDVYEPLDSTIVEINPFDLKNGDSNKITNGTNKLINDSNQNDSISNGNRKDNILNNTRSPNGTNGHITNVAKKKEALKINKFQNGNNVNSNRQIDLNQSTETA